MRNACAFAPPKPSYKVENGKIVYAEERFGHDPKFQAAADMGHVEFLEIASGDQVPVVWLKHDDARAWRDPNRSQTTGGTKTPREPSLLPYSDTISEASEPTLAYCQLGACIFQQLPGTSRDLSAQQLPFDSSISKGLAEPEYGGFPMRDIQNWGHHLACLSPPQAPSTALPWQCGASCDGWDLDCAQCSAAGREHHATPSSGREMPFLVIHFHANSTDIGEMMSRYQELSQNMCVDVLGVEYSGYGAASGQPSPDMVMQAADAAYEYAVISGVPPSRILLYGHSIGSGPAAGLAKQWPVAGAILHSPFLSGIQILDPSPECCFKPSCIFSCCDFFHNDHAMRSVRCPVFIMHGQDDVFVPIYHAMRLKDRLPENCAVPAYFRQGAGHNNLVEVDPETYYAYLRAFVNSIEEDQAAALGKAIGEEMATSGGQLLGSQPAQMEIVSSPSEGQPMAPRPAQVVMVSLRSGGIAREDRHTQIV